jgi:hypothetical protein
MSGQVPPSSRAKKRGPSRTQAQKVALLFERFTGHQVQEAHTVKVPPLPSVVAEIGPCDFIGYTAVRDGKTEKYIHKFRASDKPMLCVTPDGKQILLVGGRYRFTSLGIVDASDKKHSRAR